MIRKLFPIILVAGLTACSSFGTQSISSDAPVSGTTSSTPSSNMGSTDCNAERVQNLIGSKYSTSIDGNLRTTANAQQLRILRPGQVMTMEYNPSRLNVILESGDVISALRCG